MIEPIPTEQDYVLAAKLLTPLARGRKGCRVCGLWEADLAHALFHVQRGESAADRRTRRSDEERA